MVQGCSQFRSFVLRSNVFFSYRSRPCGENREKCNLRFVQESSGKSRFLRSNKNEEYGTIVKNKRGGGEVYEPERERES